MVWASKCAWVLLVLWLSLAVSHGDGAQVGAPSPSKDCTSDIFSLVDCLTFVEPGSNLTKPQGQCCSALKKVVKKDVTCLCEVFKEGPSLGITLNVTKTLTLPSACGISTPPFSQCNISLPGVPAPAPAPSAGGSGSIVPAPTAANSGVRASPVPPFVLGAAAAVALCFRYI